VTVGTKSLLFGAHWPPHLLMVTFAWRWLYGSWPSMKELGCICLHDIGYFGSPNMDGKDTRREGLYHPEMGAKIADWLFGKEYGDLIRGHSKGYANRIDLPLSRLYGPDKLSHSMEMAWCYVLRTRMTGELAMYRAADHGCAPRNDDPTVTDREWFRIIRARMARGGLNYFVEKIVPDGFGSSNGR